VKGVGYKDKPKIVDIQKHNRNEAQNVRKRKKKKTCMKIKRQIFSYEEALFIAPSICSRRSSTVQLISLVDNDEDFE